jgi:hypothetical protein
MTVVSAEGGAAAFECASSNSCAASSHKLTKVADGALVTRSTGSVSVIVLVTTDGLESPAAAAADDTVDVEANVVDT